MDKSSKSTHQNYLVDTGVFIAWWRGEPEARALFRNPPGVIYYAKQTRKELLHPRISNTESRIIQRLLGRFKQINPDDVIAQAFSELYCTPFQIVGWAPPTKSPAVSGGRCPPYSMSITKAQFHAVLSIVMKYPYLKGHYGDALIAATVWAKNLILVTTNPRHF